MRIGVLLCGCGLYDGSDVYETVLVLQALDAAGEKPRLLAPDRTQARTMDHTSGALTPGDERNVLRESARLARGRVEDLARVPPEDLEALIIPGGYGPGVNLADGFAERGAARALDPGVERLVRHCLDEGKPIGVVGLGEIPVRRITGEPIEAPAPPEDPAALRIDARHAIVFTPGFAAFTRLAEVRAGIEAMTAHVLGLLEERAARAGQAGRAGSGT